MWTTASAAVFFLGETEAYFQTEVVEGLWRGFRAWLAGEAQHEDDEAAEDAVPTADAMDIGDDEYHDDDDQDDHHERLFHSLPLAYFGD